MENENMVYEAEVMDLVPVEEETQESNASLSTGVAMLIGGALTAGVMFGVKQVKKAVAKHKAKKAEKKAEVAEECEDEE